LQNRQLDNRDELPSPTFFVERQMPRAECPHCKARFRFPESACGKDAQCPKCREVIMLPEAEIPTLEEDIPILEEIKPRLRKEAGRIVAVGINGQVELLGNRVVISRKGFRSWLSHGSSGDKQILLRFMTGVEFREKGFLGRGYIRFLFMGSTELANRSVGGWASAGKFRARDLSMDENTVVFGWRSRQDFIDFKEAVEDRLGEID
jgi:hypothetical protein